MRFVLLVEGQTEHRSVSQFLQKWLNPQLKSKVGIDPTSFKGVGNFLNDVKQRTHTHLTSPAASQVIAVIGLLDLYGADFIPADLSQVGERIAWGEQHIEQIVGSPQFRMHFAVHEYEAWLLSDPEIFPADVRDSLRQVSQRPEQVNFDRPPSQLLTELYRRHMRRRYQKIRDGSQLYDKLDPKVAARSCPNLKAMLDDMLVLAKAAGL